MTGPVDIDGLLGKEPIQQVIAGNRFRPWHKPRKQFIRDYQWAAMLRDLLNVLGKHGPPRTVSYFGLPGEDLLDVRVFHDVVAEMGPEWRLRYLGFNSRQSTDHSLAEAIMQDLPQIVSTGSICRNWPLQALDNTIRRSPAMLELGRFGALDVVNIDLCDGVSPPGSPSVLPAIRALIEHQRDSRADPWLLFLTTRIDPGALHSGARSKLIECVSENIKAHANFRAELVSELALDAQDILAMQASTTSHSPGDVSVVGLGIAKWLLGLLANHPHKLELGPAYKYAIGAAHPNMASLAFRFLPKSLALSDPSGLTADPAPLPAAALEGVAAQKMVKPLASMEDVDQILQNDSQLAHNCIESAAVLLARAGHNRDQYVDWLRSESQGVVL